MIEKQRPVEHGPDVRDGEHYCRCGAWFDDLERLADHLKETLPSDPETDLLLEQLVQMLGTELMEAVTESMRASHHDGPCICPALVAYGTLYANGWAIVPMDMVRRDIAARN
jgi:hypothetical protein